MDLTYYPGLITEAVFEDCTYLETVNMPQASGAIIGGGSYARGTSTGQYAFSGCSALETVNIAKVSGISQVMFFNCKALQFVDMSGATEIEKGGFAGAGDAGGLVLKMSNKGAPTLIDSYSEKKKR